MTRPKLTRGTTPDVRKLLDKASQLGCRVELTNGGHFKIFVPDGSVVFCPCTPSDRRGLLNTRAQLRRAGVAL